MKVVSKAKGGHSTIAFALATIGGFVSGAGMMLAPPLTLVLPVAGVTVAAIATSAHRKWLTSRRDEFAARDGERSHTSQIYGDKLTWYREQAALYWVLGFFATLAGVGLSVVLHTSP